MHTRKYQYRYYYFITIINDNSDNRYGIRFWCEVNFLCGLGDIPADISTSAISVFLDKCDPWGSMRAAAKLDEDELRV